MKYLYSKNWILLTLGILLLLSINESNHFCQADDRTITAGGLTTTNHKVTQEQVAFEYGIDYFHERLFQLYQLNLSAILNIVDRSQFLNVQNPVCDQVANGAIALFGPLVKDGVATSIIALLASSLNIPRFSIDDKEIHTDDTTFYMAPSEHMLDTIAVDIVKQFNWHHFDILFDGALRIERLVNDPMVNTWHYTAHEFLATTKAEKRILAKNILTSSLKRNITKFMINCDETNVVVILQQAYEFNMLNDSKYKWILSTVDLPSIYDDVVGSFGEATITTLRFQPVFMRDAKRIERHILKKYKERNPIRSENRSILRISAKLAFDSVEVLSKVIEDIYDTHHSVFSLNSPKLLPNCNDNKRYPTNEFIQRIQNIHIRGLTGIIEYDANKVRRGYTVEIINATAESIITNPVVIATRYSGSHQAIWTSNVPRKVLKVVTIIAKPFVFTKDYDPITGSQSYEGFCIDIMDAIKEMLGLDYELYLVEDQQYGARYNNGSWSGLIGQLVEQKADVALADLTISLIRETVADFTVPFLYSHSTALISNPGQREPDLFQFFFPFKTEVWIALVISSILVSLLLGWYNRLSPYSWGKNEDVREAGQDQTFYNSMWFTYSSLLQQGSETTPRGLSSRILGGSWWFFVLIITQTYTAKLTAFLSVTPMKPIIHSLTELSNSSYAAGAIRGGQTSYHFNSSRRPVDKIIWKKIQESNGLMPTLQAGIKRTRNGSFAFLIDKATADYYVLRRPCNLLTIGKPFGHSPLGIGLQKGSPYVKNFSLAILTLQDRGYMDYLRKKWWTDRSQCDNNGAVAGNNSGIGLHFLAGIFMTLFLGLSFGYVFLLLEIIYKNFFTEKPKRDILIHKAQI